MPFNVNMYNRTTQQFRGKKWENMCRMASIQMVHYHSVACLFYIVFINLHIEDWMKMAAILQTCKYNCFKRPFQREAQI